jgi:hypothetical protein
VNETLVEIALARLGRAPPLFQLLVRGEELATADQREPAREVIRRRS